MQTRPHSGMRGRWASAAAFYDRMLGTLGRRRIMDFGVAIGYGSDKPEFRISAQPPQGPASGPNREVHIAFTAPDAETVRAFFKAATESGAEVLHEPRLWPEYHEDYFGAFVRDPTGTTSRRCVTPQARQVDPAKRQASRGGMGR